ncbi:MAG: GreA/GreB family elongation factor [Pseudolabrys sp.]|nr:GreA/GreB family elongation factor [Pseudolabrys sp.]
MSNFVYPDICVARSEHARLEQLALGARNDLHPVADFLLSELHRAHIADEAFPSQPVVGLDRWVTFAADSDQLQTRILVHPDEYFSSRHQLSVLSPIGAALLGLGVADRMPFVSLEGTQHFVTAVGIGTIPVVVPFSRTAANGRAMPERDPTDPGSSAA